jgi:hypothetical protein
METTTDPVNPDAGSAALPLPIEAAEELASVSLRLPPAQAALMPLTVTDVTTPETSSLFWKVNPSLSQPVTAVPPPPSRVDATVSPAARAATAEAAVATRITSRIVLLIGRVRRARRHGVARLVGEN